jgi:hypothetical protein
MQYVQTYLYDNKIEIQILDPSITTTRNRQVYSRTVTVYQGIDNPIQIDVKNQDQKPANLTGYALQADIQDPVNRVTVESFAVTFSNISLGRGSFVIDKTTVDSLEQRNYKVTFKTIKTADNTEKPVYVDDNYGVPLDLRVLPAYYSSSEPAPGVDESVLDGGTL